MPASMASRGVAMREFLTVERDAAADLRIGAEDQPRHLGAARADEARDPEDLAAAQTKRAAVDAPAIADVVDGEEGIAVKRLAARFFLVEAGEVAPDHHPDDPFRRQLVARDRADDDAIAEHRDAVGEARDLRQAVADIDDGKSAFAQLDDEIEQPLRFMRGERGGRLVHDEDAGIGVDGAGDLDELAFGERKARYDIGRGKGCAEAFEDAAAARLHRLPVGEDALSDLAAEIDVLGDREVRAEAQLLIDDRNAHGEGGGGRVHLRRHAANADFALVAGMHSGEDLDQRRLAGAVLAHHRMHLAGGDREVRVDQRADAGEVLGDVPHFKQRGGAGRRTLRCDRLAVIGHCEARHSSGTCGIAQRSRCAMRDGMRVWWKPSWPSSPCTRRCYRD